MTKPTLVSMLAVVAAGCLLQPFTVFTNTGVGMPFGLAVTFDEEVVYVATTLGIQSYDENGSLIANTWAIGTPFHALATSWGSQNLYAYHSLNLIHEFDPSLNSVQSITPPPGIQTGCDITVGTSGDIYVTAIDNSTGWARLWRRSRNAVWLSTPLWPGPDARCPVVDVDEMAGEVVIQRQGDWNSPAVGTLYRFDPDLTYLGAVVWDAPPGMDGVLDFTVEDGQAFTATRQLVSRTTYRNAVTSFDMATGQRLDTEYNTGIYALPDFSPYVAQTGGIGLAVTEDYDARLYVLVSGDEVVETTLID